MADKQLSVARPCLRFMQPESTWSINMYVSDAKTRVPRQQPRQETSQRIEPQVIGGWLHASFSQPALSCLLKICRPGCGTSMKEMAYLLPQVYERRIFPALGLLVTQVFLQGNMPAQITWSGRQDLNLRPHGPKPCALPNCATPRRLGQSMFFITPFVQGSPL